MAFSRLHTSVYTQTSLLILKRKIESIEQVKQKNEIETLLEKKANFSFSFFPSFSFEKRKNEEKKINKSLLSRHFLMTQHLYCLFITRAHIYLHTQFFHRTLTIVIIIVSSLVLLSLLLIIFLLLLLSSDNRTTTSSFDDIMNIRRTLQTRESISSLKVNRIYQRDFLISLLFLDFLSSRSWQCIHSMSLFYSFH